MCWSTVIIHTMQENSTFTLINCKSYRDASSKSPFLFAQLKICPQFLWSHDHCTKPELGFLSNRKVDYYTDLFWRHILTEVLWVMGHISPWRWACTIWTFGEFEEPFISFCWCCLPFLLKAKPAFLLFSSMAACSHVLNCWYSWLSVKVQWHRLCFEWASRGSFNSPLSIAVGLFAKSCQKVNCRLVLNILAKIILNVLCQSFWTMMYAIYTSPAAWWYYSFWPVAFVLFLRYKDKVMSILPLLFPVTRVICIL